MTTVSGDIRLVSDAAAPVSQVWVSAPKMRAADGAIITAFHDRFDVREGRVSFPCRPGPARVTLVSAGQPTDSFDILVPAGESVSLEDAAKNFQIAGEESPETLMQYLDEIRRVGAAVKADIGGAKQAASQASGHKDAAQRAASQAQGHASTAQGHASTAQGHAQDASGHASAAASSESEAGKAAVRAEGARSEARTNWDNARAAQTGAEQARDTAQGHANTAQGHANTASTQATKSENAANRLWDSVAWNGDRLTVAGRQSESLTGPQGPPGPAGTVEGLEPETIVRTDSEPTFGRRVNMSGDGSAYTILKMTAGDKNIEQYVTSGGDFGVYDGSNRYVAKADVFEHHTATDMRGNQLRGLTAPTANDHAATKAYVDGISATFVTAEDIRNADLIPRSELTEKLENMVRTGDQDTRLGKYLTVDATDQGNASASLFLKKNDHQYEFFTNAVGKFGAWDKRHSRGLFQADRNTFEHQTAVNMGDNQLRGLPSPSGNDHAATKQYVDSAVENVSVDTSGLAERNHRHTSADITDAVGRVARSSAGKLVKVSDTGSVDLDYSPLLSTDATNKRYVDTQVGKLVRVGSGSRETVFSALDKSESRLSSTSSHRLVCTTNLGHIHVREPEYPENPATKRYTDNKFDSLVSRVGALETRIQAVSELPSRPDSNTLYLITG